MEYLEYWSAPLVVDRPLADQIREQPLCSPSSRPMAPLLVRPSQLKWTESYASGWAGHPEHCWASFVGADVCVCVSPWVPGKIKKRTLHTGGRVDVHCRPTSPLLSPPPRLQFAQRGRQQQQQTTKQAWTTKHARMAIELVDLEVLVTFIKVCGSESTG